MKRCDKKRCGYLEASRSHDLSGGTVREGEYCNIRAPRYLIFSFYFVRAWEVADSCQSSMLIGVW